MESLRVPMLSYVRTEEMTDDDLRSWLSLITIAQRHTPAKLINGRNNALLGFWSLKLALMIEAARRFDS